LNAFASHPLLLCYDGSPGSKLAIETAGGLFPGHVAVVLHVWSPTTIVRAPYNAITPAPIPQFNDQEIRKSAMELAERGVEAAAAAGLPARAEIAEAALAGVWSAVLEVANEYDVALIVLGSRGLSTFESLLLGSVSHGIVQHARRPVMIVPPAADVAKIAAPAAAATASA
jgi:nucleotide-binding universal stress UspA family protein